MERREADGEEPERGILRQCRVLPWKKIDSATVARDEMTLWQRGEEFSIRIGTTELMNSRMHHSEELLSELALAGIASRSGAAVLIGGLGIGYTLAAALRVVRGDARVTVAELVPSVVRWNREVIGHLAGQPLRDPRVAIFEGDVAAAIRRAREDFDAILLDVDNGPAALTTPTNDAIYSDRGVESIRGALRQEGVLAMWSEASSPRFVARLERHGFRVQERRVHGSRSGGSRYVITIANKVRR